MTRIPQANSVIAQHWRASLSILTFGLWQVSGHAQTQLPASPVANNVSAAAVSEPPINSRATTLTGTLFNTREQRERLDRARQRGGVIEDNVETIIEPKRSVINGFVKRDDGHNTVWVDDVMNRNPRTEVIEQLEPSMVGGNIALRRATSTVEEKAPPTVTRRPTVRVTKHARKHTRKIAKPTLRKIAVVK